MKVFKDKNGVILEEGQWVKKTLTYLDYFNKTKYRIISKENQLYVGDVKLDYYLNEGSDGYCSLEVVGYEKITTN
jgi:hypothetical protein